MAERLMLHEALELIRELVTTALRDETGPDGMVAGVTDVVWGDRKRGQPSTPSLWVNPQPARTAQAPGGPGATAITLGLAEAWVLPLDVLAVVRSEAPEEGYAAADELAARARSVLIRHRDLGRPEVVRDVRSVSFEPSSPDFRDGVLFGAVAGVEIVFLILEPR